jgi:hypothetical protein
MHINCRLLYICLSIPCTPFDLPVLLTLDHLYTYMHFSTDPRGTRAHYCAGEKSCFEIFFTHGVSNSFGGVHGSLERSSSTKQVHRSTIEPTGLHFVKSLNLQANSFQRSRYQPCTYMFTVDRLTLFMRNLICSSCCIDTIVLDCSVSTVPDTSHVGCFQTQVQLSVGSLASFGVRVPPELTNCVCTLLIDCLTVTPGNPLYSRTDFHSKQTMYTDAIKCSSELHVHHSRCKQDSILQLDFWPFPYKCLHAHLLHVVATDLRLP